MRHLRRPAPLFFQLREERLLDPAELLTGQLRLHRATRLIALSPRLEGEPEVTGLEAELLARVPAERWTPLAELATTLACPPERLEELARRGLLLTTENVEVVTEPEDDPLEPWHPLAALYHFRTRWRDRHRSIFVPEEEAQLAGFEETTVEQFSQLVEQRGAPPPHLHRPAASEGEVALPAAELSEPLAELLTRRQTHRRFDRARPMTAEAFATLLRFTFGVWGTQELAPGVTAVRKTSPSGGALHPTEAYPLVLRVEGLTPGLYHYRPHLHRLGKLRSLGLDEAEELARVVAAGQSFAASAGALVLLTTRFERSFWKYHRHDKAYSVLLTDVGHLSQTFYLLAAQLGLGAFYTGAVSTANIEEQLGISAEREGALGLLGCGVPADRQMALALTPEPWTPPEEPP